MMAFVMELSGIPLEDVTVGRRRGTSCVGDGGALAIDSRRFGGGAGSGGDAVFMFLPGIGRPYMLMAGFGVALVSD